MVENIEKKRARGREYYRKNKEKILKQKKEYFSRPEVKVKLKEYMQEYHKRKAKNK